jgi:uncharacterized membrane protein
MRLAKQQVFSLVLVAIGFVVSAAFYRRLPDPVPVHWNVHGEPDGYMAKPMGAFVLNLVMVFVYLLFQLSPRLSPRGFRFEGFRGSYVIIQQATLTFLLLLLVVTDLAAIGTPLPLDRIVTAGLGGLFVVLGNFMGKMRKNFFIGIRTPWTLASDEVWLRTHRLGGRVFVLAGAGMITAGLSGAGAGAVLPLGLAAGLIPAVYSYVIYRKIERG